MCLLVPISTNTLIPACQSASTCFVCVFVITAPSLGCVFVFGMQTKKTPLPLDLVQNNPEKPMDGTTSICSRADACQLSGGIASGTRVYSPSVFTKEKKICCNCFIKVLHTGKHDGQLVSRGKKNNTEWREPKKTWDNGSVCSKAQKDSMPWHIISLWDKKN